MWWNGPGWGPMNGFWIMPFFFIIFLVIVLFIVSRFFGGGGFCGRTPSRHDSAIDDLKKEIQALRDEVLEPKNKDKKGGLKS
jgi:hypothetical protein